MSIKKNPIIYSLLQDVLFSRQEKKKKGSIWESTNNWAKKVIIGTRLRYDTDDGTNRELKYTNTMLKALMEKVNNTHIQMINFNRERKIWEIIE